MEIDIILNDKSLVPEGEDAKQRTIACLYACKGIPLKDLESSNLRDVVRRLVSESEELRNALARKQKGETT